MQEITTRFTDEQWKLIENLIMDLGVFPDKLVRHAIANLAKENDLECAPKELREKIIGWHGEDPDNTPPLSDYDFLEEVVMLDDKPIAMRLER